mgnify:CR=1
MLIVANTFERRILPSRFSFYPDDLIDNDSAVCLKTVPNPGIEADHTQAHGHSPKGYRIQQEAHGSLLSCLVWL